MNLKEIKVITHFPQSLNCPLIKGLILDLGRLIVIIVWNNVILYEYMTNMT